MKFEYENPGLPIHNLTWTDRETCILSSLCFFAFCYILSCSNELIFIWFYKLRFTFNISLNLAILSAYKYWKLSQRAKVHILVGNCFLLAWFYHSYQNFVVRRVNEKLGPPYSVLELVVECYFKRSIMGFGDNFFPLYTIHFIFHKIFLFC